MNRNYYPINETAAKTAHDMMSMRDYKHGSTTNSYRAEADKAYDLADKIAEKRPAEAERAYRLADRYSKKMSEYYNKENSIGLICPSVLVSGPANFPVKKKERQVAAWERNHQFYNDNQRIIEKLNSILYGKEIIKSDDEHAIEKLEEKLEDLKNRQELMKAANKAIRLKNIEDGNDKLRELGFDEESIRKLRDPDFCGRTGYPSFELTNNNANIHRIEQRIKNLKAVKDKGTTEKKYENFKVIENTDVMRYQIIFEEKPDTEVRSILKSNGFKWAPSQGAWQRQITGNGKWALTRVIDLINNKES